MLSAKKSNIRLESSSKKKFKKKFKKKIAAKNTI